MTALRHRLALWVACGLLTAPPSHAEPAASLSVDIAAQSLATALVEFHRQTGLQLVYTSNLVEAQSSAGAQAGLGPSAALAELLAGTKLRFEFLNERTIGIFPAEGVASATDRSPGTQPRRRSRGGELGVALEEVIVTATRREEQVNRVPISMTVWTQDTMEVSGIKNIAQLSALTPGIDFSYRSGIGSDLYTDLAIRGVQNRHGAVASIYLDDVPIPPARGVTYLRSFPYIFDLDRVEILRGPQSMLLGDHTQGGALKFFVIQPSLIEYSALARAGWATTAGGAPGYEFGAATGGPIVNEKLGFRVSGWYQEQGGYVDRVNPFTEATVAPNSNSVVAKTANGAVTYAPTDAVRITPSVAYQSTTIRDSSTFYTALSDPGSGEFRNAYLVAQPFTDNYDLSALRITAALRFAELSSLTSYFHRTAAATIDLTALPLIDYAHASPWYPSLVQRVFSQEVRVSSKDLATAHTWMAGLLYATDHTDHAQTFVDSGSVTPGDTLSVKKTETEAFGQFDLKLSKRLTASAGVRFGHSRYDYATEFPPVTRGVLSNDWTAPRFVLTCQQNEQQLFYLTVAKGIGSGGVNPDVSSSPVIAQLQPSEALWSYEIGGKSAIAGGRMHVDASVFHIHWDNRWDNTNSPNGTGEIGAVPGTINSNGIDLAVQAQATEHLQLALAAEYADVRFARSVTVDGVVIARKGDSLGAAPFSATASVGFGFPLRGSATLNVRIEDAYRSGAGHTFSENQGSPYYGPIFALPSTNVINLRAAIRWPRFDVAVLVNNAADSHTLLQTGFDFPNNSTEIAETIIPRTLSVTGTWRY